MKTNLILICFCLVFSGCVVIYQPNGSLYSHEQKADAMTINQDIDPQAKLADNIKGVVGADLEGAGSNFGNNNGSNNKVEVSK